MQNRRQWANATVLSNGQVVVTGGTRFADNGGADAVLAAESWNPSTGAWSALASAAVVRNYHSATVLLQNGAILSAGGGVPGGTNAPSANLNAEIYYPPYLFRTSNGQTVLADRPRIVSISARRFAYGSSFQVEMSDTRAIGRISILGLGSTTHSFDMGQRFIPATFSQSGAMLTVTAPANDGEPIIAGCRRCSLGDLPASMRGLCRTLHMNRLGEPPYVGTIHVNRSPVTPCPRPPEGHGCCCLLRPRESFAPHADTIELRRSGRRSRCRMIRKSSS